MKVLVFVRIAIFDAIDEFSIDQSVYGSSGELPRMRNGVLPLGFGSSFQLLVRVFGVLAAVLFGTFSSPISIVSFGGMRAKIYIQFS